MIVKEIIVVEGRSDTEAIRRALDADTIETNGSRVSRRTIRAIQNAQKRRGVIVFTDPDYPGERIRKIVSQAVPGCKHAFITRAEGQGGANESLGIEHAAPHTILRSLAKVYTQFEEPEEQISMQTLRSLGLLGSKASRKIREQLCDQLNIGYANGKQLYKRLRMFQISERDLKQAMDAIGAKEQSL
ncbi:ribonuclease M5 [Sporolactobacillus inulinus]|jgi:ribonuclease M5|uniref:Ribonuclease M5 n=2 Tax=Sporolactobacillus inulinus TaxID=2078 RepID=A0A4Y1ZHB5_9BACL|nr:ribonuclease M5 [Sporolactobacillus inulinus]KLI01887.1 ribonuclease M5 [Sporolactobacillus inulinus CASD]GAY78525.1 ribonuclease M5 [Sporolactobacillus inulinus]GEB78039.1 ribonuclease M5 [Sporolactobacillus inulinus]